MIPAQTDAGRSFKGAAAYYLHDKREEGVAQPFTAERVAWAETLNLATADPERGWRMMAHTAIAQADLKAAAGGKATGRKLEKPVFAYSLSWAPDERPDRAEQMKAARDTLTALGLEDHQAIIVSHNDEPHPHIHILVNRVHPETGKAATLSNSKLKLSKWALDFERAQGRVRCEQRERNHERRSQGEKVREPRKPRPVYEQEQGRATGNDDLKAEFVKTEQRQKDAHLYDLGRAMRASHSRQWDATKAVYETARSRVSGFAKQTGDAAASRIREDARPRWRELHRQQREARSRFVGHERGIIGRMLHMVGTFRAVRAADPQADAMTIFFYLASSAGRMALFDRGQEAERRDLAGRISEEIRDARRTAGRSADRDHIKLRDTYLAQCAALKSDQAKDRAELDAKWTVRKAERAAALGPYRTPRQAQRRPRQSRGRSIRDDERYRPSPPRRDWSPS